MKNIQNVFRTKQQASHALLGHLNYINKQKVQLPYYMGSFGHVLKKLLILKLEFWHMGFTYELFSK
jgi:hypothetical protein